MRYMIRKNTPITPFVPGLLENAYHITHGLSSPRRSRISKTLEFLVRKPTFLWIQVTAEKCPELKFASISRELEQRVTLKCKSKIRKTNSHPDVLCPTECSQRAGKGASQWRKAPVEANHLGSTSQALWPQVGLYHRSTGPSPSLTEKHYEQMWSEWPPKTGLKSKPLDRSSGVFVSPPPLCPANLPLPLLPNLILSTPCFALEIEAGLRREGAMAHISRALSRKNTPAAFHPLLPSKAHLFPSTSQSLFTECIIRDVLRMLSAAEFPKNYSF